MTNLSGISTDLNALVSPQPLVVPLGASTFANAFGSATTTTSVTATNDNNIDGLLYETRWSSTSLTFSFTDSIDDYETGYHDRGSHATGFQSLSATQQAAARAWIGVGGQFDQVSLLSPTELTGTSDRDATLRIAQSTVPGTAFAYLPGGTVEGGDAWFGSANGYYTNPVMGDYAFVTFGHELGHALGLKHGHEADGVSGVSMNSDRDSMEFSIMTYRSYVGHDLSTLPHYTNGEGEYAQSLMMYDIAAIQKMYGAAFDANATNTTYTFSTTTGEMFVNGVGQGTPSENRIFRTVWDGNGVDTYDFSNYTTNLSVDLTPGGWSDLDVGGNSQRANLNAGFGGITEYARGHVFNALQYNGDARSLIENANGGLGNDSLQGNGAKNFLNGNAGNDTLFGNSGNDSILGGVGSDSLDGGQGVDVLDYQGSTMGVTVNLLTASTSGGDAQGDTIANFEYVNGSSFADQLSGDSQTNSLVGLNGDDTLSGDNGNDVIRGGVGADSLDGGQGIDILNYQGAAAGVVVNLATLSASGGEAQGDVFANFENVYGSSLADQLSGDDQANTLMGFIGADTLVGNGGNDIIRGGMGSDSLDGGQGTDIVDYQGSTVGVTVNLSGAIVSGGDAQGDAIANFESIYGSSFADQLEGDGQVNLLMGFSGNDSLSGGEGNDGIRGGAGADLLTGGLGRDRFDCLLNSDSLLSNLDVITDFQIGVDRFNWINAVSAVNLSELGVVQNLDEAGIQGVLSTANFVANGAATFTLGASGGSRTFLALNNATAGFSAGTDAIVEITGYSGPLTSLSTI
jgi:serralysin